MTQPRAILIATAKNEAPYFLEWVAHHLEVGFTDIVIYQNDSDDLTHQTLVALRNIGAIEYYYNRAVAGRHQVRAYTRSGNLPQYAESDWAMALDLDEFLVVKTGDGTIKDLMKALPDSDCIQLNWRLFGNSGYETLTDQLVTDRFRMANYQMREPDHFGAYKCMFRPSLFERPGIHRPNGPKTPEETIRYTNGSGLAPEDYALKNFNSNDPGGCKFAQINHYIVRDLSSFMLKSARGSAHQSNREIGHRYWTMRNKNFEIDDSMQPFVARVKARMAALDKASDGRLMELREAAIFTHLARYYTMLQEPDMRAFRTFCKEHPNAVDYRKVALEKAKAEVAAKPKDEKIAARVTEATPKRSTADTRAKSAVKSKAPALSAKKPTHKATTMAGT
ncbi:glycosyltransferase family 2 protein [Pseudorhodobacter ferrugineus]|uniref:glycosyltransferase family 2 protein n=1 Tax=Pseudorhodobacter ferrugineus TaxID=77008 RepID=UPI0003B36C60|nr:glycosyltransferase family 2 protein [Pseudorhodobacter ferrugineus]